MNEWNLELGIVKCWDDTQLKYIQKEVSILYNPDDSMKVTIICGAADGKTMNCSLELRVKILDEERVEICDDIYLLTPEQIDMLNSVKEYWYIEKNNECAAVVTEEKLDSWEKHPGLVLYYDSETHKFELTDLDIMYDLYAKHKVELKMKTFDSDTHIAEKVMRTMSDSFTFKFVSYENDLQLYRICHNNFLLNDYQARIIDSLELYREEDYDDE